MTFFEHGVCRADTTLSHTKFDGVTIRIPGIIIYNS